MMRFLLLIHFFSFLYSRNVLLAQETNSLQILDAKGFIDLRNVGVTLEPNDIVELSDGNLLLVGKTSTNDDSYQRAYAELTGVGQLKSETSSGNLSEGSISFVAKVNGASFYFIGESSATSGKMTELIISEYGNSFNRELSLSGVVELEDVLMLGDSSLILGYSTRPDKSRTDKQNLGLLKVNSHGVVVWKYELKKSGMEHHVRITRADDESIDVAASSSDGLLLVRISESGKQLFRTNLSSDWTQEPVYVRSESGSTIVLGTEGEILGGEDGTGFLFNVDHKGTVKSNYSISIPGYSIIIRHGLFNSDGSYTICGRVGGPGLLKSIFLAQISSDGKLLKSFAFKMPKMTACRANRVVKLKSDEIVLLVEGDDCGTSRYFLMKLDKDYHQIAW